MEREPVDFIPATAMRKPRRKEWYRNNEKKKRKHYPPLSVHLFPDVMCCNYLLCAFCSMTSLRRGRKWLRTPWKDTCIIMSAGPQIRRFVSKLKI
jgi:hypothetical protein